MPLLAQFAIISVVAGLSMVVFAVMAGRTLRSAVAFVAKDRDGR